MASYVQKMAYLKTFCGGRYVMVLNMKKILIAVGGVVLVAALIIGCVFLVSSLSSGKNDSDELNWNSLVLSSKLPATDAEYGVVNYDSITQLDVKITDVEFSFYENYVNSCVEMGYTIDSDEDDITYKASNEDGYFLMLYYSKTAGDMTIVLNNPDATSSNKEADYVTEQGVSGDWNYRIWASGTVECWGLISAEVKKVAETKNIEGLTHFNFEIPKPSFLSDDVGVLQVTPNHWACVSAQGQDYGTIFGCKVYGRTVDMAHIKVGSKVELNIYYIGTVADSAK